MYGVESEAVMATILQNPESSIRQLADKIIKHIFAFLDGVDLARVRQVCRRWNDLASEPSLWRTLCLKRWRSLDTDKDLWPLLDNTIDVTDPNRWRHIYPKVCGTLSRKFRLQRNEELICNVVAHQISGPSLGEEAMPPTVKVERRFNTLHLTNFVQPDAALFYCESEAESSTQALDGFKEYLETRNRAGLALDSHTRFIFVTPGNYLKQFVGYHGPNLIMVQQIVFPPGALVKVEQPSRKP